MKNEELLRHQYWMKKAIDLAVIAGKQKEIPVGAVIIDQKNNLVVSAYNQKQQNQDATAHAEILAIQQANQKLATWQLNQCNLYVTLEPCPMCAGAIVHARLKTLIYGLDDDKTGAIRTVMNIPDSHASNHRLQVFAGICEESCRDLIRSWFQQHRQIKS